MHIWGFGKIAFYFVPQGGKFESANTIYFYPCLSLSQDEKNGFDFPNGVNYRWILSIAFLFWTVGLLIRSTSNRGA